MLARAVVVQGARLDAGALPSRRWIGSRYGQCAPAFERPASRRGARRHAGDDRSVLWAPPLCEAQATASSSSLRPSCGRRRRSPRAARPAAPSPPSAGNTGRSMSPGARRRSRRRRRPRRSRRDAPTRGCRRAPLRPGPGSGGHCHPGRLPALTPAACVSAGDNRPHVGHWPRASSSSPRCCMRSGTRVAIAPAATPASPSIAALFLVVVWAPLGVWALGRAAALGPVERAVLLASAIVHVFYFTTPLRGYRPSIPRPSSTRWHAAPVRCWRTLGALVWLGEAMRRRRRVRRRRRRHRRVLHRRRAGPLG